MWLECHTAGQTAAGKRLKCHDCGDAALSPRGASVVAQERENEVIKKTVTTAAVVMALPIAAQAQSLQYPGFYIGAEGGGTWMFQTIPARH